MTKMSKWITISSAAFLSILIFQTTLLAESNLKVKTSEKVMITERSTPLNSNQSNEFNQPEQTFIIAQNSGQNTQSNAQDWKTILGYIIGGIVVVVFILSRIQM